MFDANKISIFIKYAKTPRSISEQQTLITGSKEWIIASEGGRNNQAES